MKRAVITGLGIVSSIGNNQQEVLNSLRTGKSGISFSKEMQDSGMRSHIWGDIKLSNNLISTLIDRKNLRFMSDASIYAYLSMMEAIKDARLTSKDYQRNPRVGLLAGSGSGSPRFQVFAADALRSIRGVKAIGPYIVTKSMSSSVSACLATFFKIYGLNYSISSACATSAHCIGNAVEQIQLGKQDIIFAGGGEELSWEMACEFDAMRVLSTRYNGVPQQASRPYDINRDGFVIAGGGGIIVIEELENALARGASIYAEVVGYGANSDGQDMVVPSVEGVARCMKIAIKDIETPIDYINTHGTSTLIGDIKEIDAIREVFGDKIPYLSSTKSITGHALGAAGVQEVIYTVLMLKYCFIAPSINIEKIDPKIKDVKIITKFTETTLTTVMSNSFGFGGTNASITIRKYTI
ncbi:beta-ketoacyl-ACP synthase I [Candidatus Ishikawella capsulata]|uniref:3-oxoacyl-[acyl-carrier-protein] synthase 1 n=1 Tax=Candidatus Ishikawaella capsulata Mpkobe TaxID=476281 RepID=C5WCA9_9ENTR|nr:beta-ketoacyl-ACP synthase I [Candidatus Ishikawaella capsulata]BAH82965.1 3-oxoacyl-(acyl carrier protein) synthase [Candidatus Ishikawaella capsulata Mpkobe]